MSKKYPDDVTKHGRTSSDLVRITETIGICGDGFKLQWSCAAGSITRLLSLQFGKGCRDIDVETLCVEAQLVVAPEAWSVAEESRSRCDRVCFHPVLALPPQRSLRPHRTAADARGQGYVARLDDGGSGRPHRLGAIGGRPFPATRRSGCDNLLGLTRGPRPRSPAACRSVRA